jgi:hypothetical protein
LEKTLKRAERRIKGGESGNRRIGTERKRDIDGAKNRLWKEEKNGPKLRTQKRDRDWGGKHRDGLKKAWRQKKEYRAARRDC